MSSGGRNNDKARKAQNSIFNRQWKSFVDLVLTGKIPERFTRKQLVDLADFHLSTVEINAFLSRAVEIERIVEQGETRSRSYKVVLEPIQRLRGLFQQFYKKEKSWLSVLKRINSLRTTLDGIFSISDLRSVIVELVADTQVVPDDAELKILIAQYIREGVVGRIDENHFQIIAEAEQRLVNKLTPKPGLVKAKEPEEKGSQEDDVKKEEERKARAIILPEITTSHLGLTRRTLNRLIPLIAEVRGEIFKNRAKIRAKKLGFNTGGALNQTFIALHKAGLLINEGKGKWRWNIDKLPREWQTALKNVEQNESEAEPVSAASSINVKIEPNLEDRLRLLEEQNACLLNHIAGLCYRQYFRELPISIQQELLRILNELVSNT